MLSIIINVHKTSHQEQEIGLFVHVCPRDILKLVALDTHTET